MITLDLEKQGERIIFFSDADSAAPTVELEVRMAPGASGPPQHRHTRQSERFTVMSGRLIATVDGVARTVAEQESLTVEAGQAHTFANGSDTEPLVFRCALEPALHFHWFLSEMVRSAIRGGGSWKELPILEAAYILHEVRHEYRVAGMPDLLQDLVFGLLARTAVVLGRTREIAPRTSAPADVPAAQMSSWGQSS